MVEQMSVVLTAQNIGGPVIKERHKIKENFERPMSPSVHLFQLQLDSLRVRPCHYQKILTIKFTGKDCTQLYKYASICPRHILAEIRTLYSKV